LQDTTIEEIVRREGSTLKRGRMRNAIALAVDDAIGTTNIEGRDVSDIRVTCYQRCNSK
jgi:hypothetical protein